jgi:SAM-dependent methyltransferase
VTERNVSREDVLQANVYIHTSLIDLYDDQPHFRPENKRKVSEILAGLRVAVAPTVSGKSKLLDMGCGTGFLLALAEPLFDELHGVDITPAMLEKVDLSSGKISLHCGPVEQTPFENDAFDLVTAYSFMDHLFDLQPFLAEVFRVLKPGGRFYADQNANRAFWEAVGRLDGPLESYSAIVQREITAGLRSEEEYAKKRDIDTESFRIAEYIKTQENGIDAEQVVAIAREVGFKSCTVRYDWYLGQGKVMHGQSFADSNVVEAYLREVAPLSDHLFKYLRFDLAK